MKTSTKVILKFQLFTSIILFIILFLVNILFFESSVSQYNEKIIKMGGMMMNMNFHQWEMEDWRLLKDNCFTRYQQKYCLTNANKNIFWFYHIKDKFFYIKNNVVIDITNFLTFQKLFIKTSIFILLFYLLFSYFIWKLFLKTIYKKIFQAIWNLEKENYINIKSMKLSNDDELKILFETINNQIDSISSFNKYLSHELKTPLMNISSSLDILALKYDDEKFSQLKKEVFNIKNIIDILNKLIVIENKKLKLEKIDINICDKIKKIANSINLEYNIRCDINNILVNDELFNVLINNLLINAKKYAKWDIKIILTDNFLEISNKSDKIQNLEKLTKKFYKEWDKWMWIGLYLVNKICDILWYKLLISQDENLIFKIKIFF